MNEAVPHEREGVIKFSYEMVEEGPVVAPGLRTLGAWRTLMRRLGLLGADPARYGGLGFGNVSQRVSQRASQRASQRVSQRVSQRAGPRPDGDGPGFYISGSQTGHLEKLAAEHWVEVLDCQPERNTLRARGLLRPSAESMTHAAVYAQTPAIRCVLHGHSRELFAAAAALGFATTAAEVPYGTPAMAREVGRLFRETKVARAGFFVMGGHEDGVIAFGRSPGEAGNRLLQALAQALALESG